MSKSVKLVVSIYLAVVVIICCSYLIMILVGSFQGNDMRGSVLDTDNTKNIENVDYINNTLKSSESNASPSDSVPKIHNLVSIQLQINCLLYKTLIIHGL